MLAQAGSSLGFITTRHHYSQSPYHLWATDEQKLGYNPDTQPSLLELEY